jgi:2,4-diaminopentanoate dehydrogenase
MKKIKVIQYGVGNVGKLVTKILLQKEGVEIVGALASSESDKLGKDLGEVVGIDRQIGVIVTNNSDALFSDTCADLVIHTVLGPLREAYPQIIEPIKHGMNVISAGGEVSHPYSVNPGLASKLDGICKKHGVTVLGYGLTPGFLEYLVIALTGTCSKVHKIRTDRHIDFTPYIEGSPRVVRDYGIGLNREEYARGVQKGTIVGHSAYTPLLTICDRLGWKLSEVRHTREPLFDEQEKVSGSEAIIEGIKDGEVKVEMHHRAEAKPEEEFDSITIEGVPNINMVIRPEINSIEGTAASLVNAIPHVINAAPGIMTPADLPLIFATDDMRLVLK